MTDYKRKRHPDRSITVDIEDFRRRFNMDAQGHLGSDFSEKSVIGGSFLPEQEVFHCPECDVVLPEGEGDYYKGYCKAHAFWCPKCEKWSVPPVVQDYVCEDCRFG